MTTDVAYWASIGVCVVLAAVVLAGRFTSTAAAGLAVAYDAMPNLLVPACPSC